MTFAPSTWNVPQVATVAGADDAVVDGDEEYLVLTGAAASDDPYFDGLDVDDVALVNLDDDVAGFAVSPTSAPVTSETGGRATFTIRLTSQPAANVVVALTSTDISEGTVSPASLSFTALNWNTARTVTMTGVDDALVDGPISYAAATAPATSTDPVYAGLNPPDVTFTNLDNESADLSASATDSPDPVPVGTALVLAISVVNRGMLTSNVTTLTLDVPAAAALVGLTPSQGTCAAAICQLGSMEMDASATIIAEIVPSEVGQALTTVSVATDRPDAYTVNNSVAVTTSVVAFGAAALAVDTVAPPSGASNLNGVLEPGETVAVAPSWRNYTSAPLALSSTGGLFTGNASTSYVYVDNSADYGSVGPGSVASCLEGEADCLAMKISPPAIRPGHFDATFVERLSDGSSRRWTLHVGGSFTDVQAEYWAYRHVETLLHSGITAGCGPGVFCPGEPVSRWQMAVFLSKAVADGTEVPTSGTVPVLGDFDCREGGASVFTDVPPGDPACRFVHNLAVEGVTVGCGAGAYCPADPVTRWQMAVFLAKAMADGAEVPTTGTVPGRGDYDCREGGASVFTDVPPDDPACRFVHYIAAEGVTAGCGPGIYCPVGDVSRDQMAVFVTKAFDLVLYGP